MCNSKFKMLMYGIGVLTTGFFVTGYYKDHSIYSTTLAIVTNHAKAKGTLDEKIPQKIASFKKPMYNILANYEICFVILDILREHNQLMYEELQTQIIRNCNDIKTYGRFYMNDDQLKINADDAKNTIKLYMLEYIKNKSRYEIINFCENMLILRHSKIAKTLIQYFDVEHENLDYNDKNLLIAGFNCTITKLLHKEYINNCTNIMKYVMCYN